ncbi:hypothetical protein CW713_06605 [Methanophagales archaeon]|nr:MAG: hypothetical protein CW713_06605 [Methanophagales archaeon]
MRMNMGSKLDFLKKQIENMRETVIKDEDRAIGELAKETIQEPWVNNHVEAIINTVLAMRQRWNEKAKPCFIAFQQNYSEIKKNTLKRIGLGSEVEICELISELTGYKCLELDQIFGLGDKIENSTTFKS